MVASGESGALHQSGGEEWLGVGCIVKAELRQFAYRMDGVRGGPRILPSVWPEHLDDGVSIC